MRAPIRPRHLMAVALTSVFALAASGTYVVRSGETLSQIAARNGTTVRALVDANGISNPDLIVAGQELAVPGSGSTGSASSTYVVEKGDTLARIAAKFHTTVSALASANDLSDPNLIVVGDALAVPASGGGSSTTASSSATTDGKQLIGQRHTVRSGETISGIASHYGLSQSDLVRWNGLVDGKLYATVSLVLYDPGTLPGGGAASSSSQTHIVARGETLSAIAAKFGASASAIAKASGVSDVNTISIGQTLTIPGGSGGGGYVCPVPGGTFFDDWGFPRSGGRHHAGNDIFAPRGTPVHAPTSGWVDIATGSIGGHQFRLTAADGSQWFGSHLDHFGKTGSVQAGDVIGYVGNTGNAKGGPTHLHFEIHPGANAVNPFPLLRADLLIAPPGGPATAR